MNQKYFLMQDSGSLWVFIVSDFAAIVDGDAILYIHVLLFYCLAVECMKMHQI